MAITSLTRNSIQNPNKYTDLLAGNSVYEVSSLVPIATSTLTSNGSFTFGSIPQGYQDLFMIASVRSANAGTDSIVLYTTYGSTEYSTTWLLGDGTSASSGRQSNAYTITGNLYIPNANSTAGVFGSVAVHVLNYANTTTNKTFLIRNASDVNGSGSTILSAGLRRNTAAVTSISLGGANGQLIVGSTATLYGVKAVGQ